MFDLKDTAVVLYKAAIHYIYLTWDGFGHGEVSLLKCNENCKRKICPKRMLFDKCNASLNVNYWCSKLFIVK